MAPRTRNIDAERQAPRQQPVTEMVTSPIRQLREAFGDPKPPDITRKITACVACRKQKIKCHMNDSEPPCARCKKKGLPCTVNRSLQMLLESDASWKETMERKMQKLEETIETMAKAGSQGHGDHPINQDTRTTGLPEPSKRDETSVSGQENHWEIIVDLESNPGALPGQYLHQTGATNCRYTEDIISRGVINIDNARKYFTGYQSRLDHFVYRILGSHSTSTMESVRKVSPLLMTAVCTVGALHLASPDFDPLYQAFVALSAGLSSSRKSTIDDVRALCIGALWLSDLSWSLAGLAVRIATELHLHRSFPKAIQGDRDHYFRARLYYTVYACDHHFSIPYGRPPMTRECQAVRNARDFLECKHATEDDARLVSQVLRCSACSNIYDTFGADVDRPLTGADIPYIRRFGIALDTLRAEWMDKFSPNAHVGNYPRKGVGIQHHFAKLYLGSHALRGAGSDEYKLRPQDVALEFDEIANSAVLSSISILRAVVSDGEVQSFLNGLPTYFHIMIAFAVVFLLKVSTRFSASIQLDRQEIRRLMTSLVTTLNEVVATMHPQHLLVSITKGIEEVLSRNPISSDEIRSHTASGSVGPCDAFSNIDVLPGEFNLAADGMFDQYFLNEYDFLLEQEQG
ncbi:hypothetical protein P170DRAFT_409889 [Aspergillus steynii IBT 23096]|uniref:Zn(2)-C6 fungal-type domain-containing protein n=1 Tax=Aspergillus steynii IBT 23096 TaxID=1392250 RepID=A0A2I2G470_9EURO|nr:uncharacterized protein P170DRAFT_409889 [Aspergillus steynii IBT 23096]PLB47675.1 hypothetical protein P170DRAFT_409889 [Aspergillus steynii IBT 23096]